MAYDMSLKKKWDEYSIKQTAFNDGKQEGIQEGVEKGIERGKQEGKLEEKHIIAQNLIDLGLPISQIAKSTGLSKKEVLALVQQSQKRQTE